jgi:hypothetical protein
MQFRTAAGHDAPAVTAAQMRFGNWLAARLMNRGYGLKITDLRPILGATLRYARQPLFTYEGGNP